MGTPRSWSSSDRRPPERPGRVARRGGLRDLAAGALGVLAMTVGGDGRPLVAAHRGGALLWAENTLGAFRGALRLGVDLLELDVHLTKDGEVVVIHDPTLERTTTGQGAVRDYTWAQLEGVAAKGAPGERVPRLREVLELVTPTGVGLLVEIKVGADRRRYPRIEEKVLGLLEAAGLLGRSTIMAFEWGTLARLRELSPTVRLTGLLSAHGAARLGGVPGAARRLAALRANDLGIERGLLTPEAVQAAHAAGLTIGVWTVNEADELRQALGLGVDYVTTDRPDLALELRGAR